MRTQDVTGINTNLKGIYDKGSAVNSDVVVYPLLILNPLLYLICSGNV